MYWQIEIVIFCFLIISACAALWVKNLLLASVCLTVFSFMSAILFVIFGAVDVGFTESVVGAGITGVFFILTVYNTSQRSSD